MHTHGEFLSLQPHISLCGMRDSSFELGSVKQYEGIIWRAFASHLAPVTAHTQ